MYAVPNNGWLPIEGFLRIYVTGWGGKNFSSCAYNDDRPVKEQDWPNDTGKTGRSPLHGRRTVVTLRDSQTRGPRDLKNSRPAADNNGAGQSKLSHARHI
jgi:hypothetical protein